MQILSIFHCRKPLVIPVSEHISRFIGIALSEPRTSNIYIIYLYVFIGCGHCKSLAPTYEKVAEAFKNEPNVSCIYCIVKLNEIILHACQYLPEDQVLKNVI